MSILQGYMTLKMLKIHFFKKKFKTGEQRI